MNLRVTEVSELFGVNLVVASELLECEKQFKKKKEVRTYKDQFVVCGFCGKRFPKRFGSQNKYCSQKCFFGFNRIGRRGSLTRRDSNRRYAGRKKVLNNSLV